MTTLRIGAFALATSLFACAAQANPVHMTFNDFTEPFTHQNPNVPISALHDVYQVGDAQLRHMYPGMAGYVNVKETNHSYLYMTCRGCTYANSGSGVLGAGEGLYEVTMGGGLFTFDAMDVLQNAYSYGSGATFESYLDGQITGTFTARSSDTMTRSDAVRTWLNVSGLSLGLMDRLVFRWDRGTITGSPETPFWVDNIRVTGVTNVPEPGSLALLSAAVFGAGFAGWRRKKAAQA